MSEGVKGRCPGALRPMASGDGLIVRLRLTCNEAPIALTWKIADWADDYGNGAIDLSARGNIQLRGVTEETWPKLIEELTTFGLVDVSAEAEAVRNVLVSPFAGVDPDAPFDVRPAAMALEGAIATNAAFHALPPKFSWSFDAGGFPLEDESDVRFVATEPDGFAVQLAGERSLALGPIAPKAVVPVALALAQAFLAMRSPGSPPPRMRDAIAAFGARRFAEAARLEQIELDRVSPRPRADWLGAHTLGDGAFAGIGLPFGRISSRQLRALSGLAGRAGVASLRLSPWRALLICGLSARAAAELSEAARRLDLIVDSEDPRACVTACVGAPDCVSGRAETRDVARRLAATLPNHAGVLLHVSGCQKGCAWPRPAPFTVVAAESGYDLVRHGRADEAPLARGLSLDALVALLPRLAGQIHEGAA